MFAIESLLQILTMEKDFEYVGVIFWFWQGSFENWIFPKRAEMTCDYLNDLS